MKVFQVNARFWLALRFLDLLKLSNQSESSSFWEVNLVTLLMVDKLVSSEFPIFLIFSFQKPVYREAESRSKNFAGSEKSSTAVNRRKPPKLEKHKTQLILVSFLAAFYITWRRKRCQATHVTVKHCHVIIKKASVNLPVQFAPGKWCVSGFQERIRNSRYFPVNIRKWP